jgi:hypothetical protein
MMGIPLLAGRSLTAADREGAPSVVLVSESLAGQLWPGEEPLGQQVRMPYSPAEENPWREVVGVVGDIRQYGLDRPASPAIYLPEAQYPFTYLTLMVSAVGAPERLVTPIQAVVRRLDPDQALFDVRTGPELLRRATGTRRLPGALLTGLAVAVLAIAAIGLFGIVALSVAERKREIGIRLALGARRREIRRAVLGETLSLLAVGLVAGLVAAWPATRWLQDLFYGVGAHDAVAFLAAPLVLVATALVAAWIPVRRAGRVDPMEVLRAE